MYYCPKCKKLDLNFDITKNNKYATVANIRDGWGRPIQHFLCECGNLLAGAMNISGLGNNKEEAIEYAKDIISSYNEYGIFFDKSLLDKTIKIAKIKGLI